MKPLGVLVIEQGAEAALMCAALAKRPDVRVLEARDVRGALERLKSERAALAIVGTGALNEAKELHARGITVVAVVADLPTAARERALAAGVREIHDRPNAWQPYSELIESLVSRFG